MSSKRDRRLANKTLKQATELSLLQSHGQSTITSVTTTETSMTTTEVKTSLQREKDRRTNVAIDYKFTGCLHATDVQALFLHTVLGASAPSSPQWLRLRARRLVSHTLLCAVHVGDDVEEQAIQTLHATLRSLGFGSKIALSATRHNFMRQWNSVRRSYDEVMRWRCRLDDERRQSCTSEKSSLSRDPRPFMLTETEMMHAGYPFPRLGDMPLDKRQTILVDKVEDDGRQESGDGWEAVTPEEEESIWPPNTPQDLRPHYRTPTEHSPVFAVDCEMCVTSLGPSELTRISVVDERGQCVLDTLVRPPGVITDYLTQYSGITKSMMRDVKTTLSDVHDALRRRLPHDAILLGHTFNCDLKALMLTYPYVIDISLLYNLSGRRGSRTSLSTLASIFLREKVQSSSTGHCSIEDARVTMRLWQLKRDMGLRFGNIMNEWDYPMYAKENGLNVATGAVVENSDSSAPAVVGEKRKHGGGRANFDPIDMKRVCREAADEKPLPYTNMYTCVSCKNMIKFTCRGDECCCRVMSYVSCMTCPDNQGDHEEKGELFDWRASLQASVDSTLSEETSDLSPIRPITRVMAEANKKYKVFGTATQDTDNNLATEECTQQMLSLDMAVLNLHLTSSDESLASIEESLKSLLTYAAPKAMIGCDLLVGDNQREKETSVKRSAFCVTIKK